MTQVWFQASQKWSYLLFKTKFIDHDTTIIINSLRTDEGIRHVCLSFLQQFVQQYEVHAMFHRKASVQVEDRYVPPVPVKPCPVLWKTDVYQLEDKLERNKQAARKRESDRDRERDKEREREMLVMQQCTTAQKHVQGGERCSHSVSERIQSFFSFITERTWLLQTHTLLSYHLKH